MRYRIEYADGRCCSFASSRKDLLDWLKTLKDEKVVDMRDRKSTRLNSSHPLSSRMPSSA